MAMDVIGRSQGYIWDIGTLSWIRQLQGIINTDTLIVSLAGVSTAAKQDTGNVSLASIDSKITAVNTGAITFASPQHIIADSGTITTVGAVTVITNALPAGSNVIGHVIVDSGSITTSITNDGTFAKETGGNLATIAGKDFATQTTLATLSQAQGAAAASTAGPMVQGRVGVLSPTYLSDTVLQPLSINQGGRLRVATDDGPEVWSDLDWTLQSSPWSEINSSSQFDVGNVTVADTMWES